MAVFSGDTLSVAALMLFVLMVVADWFIFPYRSVAAFVENVPPFATDSRTWLLR